MRFPFPFRTKRSSHAGLRIPQTTKFPDLKEVEIAAQYVGARIGGDFFDVIKAPNGRLVLALLDIAGGREEALNIAAHVQDAFRKEVPALFASDPMNDAEAMSTLAMTLNRTILEVANGPRCSPAFLSSYCARLGTLYSINAGHMPGFVIDESGIMAITSNGVPLGLFSHVVHDAQICVLREDDALLLASRGVAEAHSKHRELGVEGVREALMTARGLSAQELCRAVLDTAKSISSKIPDNDMTALALLRRAAAVEKKAGSEVRAVTA